VNISSPDFALFNFAQRGASPADVGHTMFTTPAVRALILAAGVSGVCPPSRHHQTTGDGTLATDLESSEGDIMAPGQTGTEAPTRELPAAALTASGDRCNNCETPLAHDQRYCVDCGEPRGQSTLPQPQPTPQVHSSRRRSPAASRPVRMSSGTTLVAGVGVLLLAIGLGVLIGRLGNNNNSPSRAPAAQVITVQGGAGTGTGSATTTPTTTAPGSHATPKAKLKAAAKATAPPSAAVQKKATQAAGKVLGNGNHLAPPTVTTGGACSNGQAGCQNNKFNGNFFGGG
jgi:hypothetical protein